MEEAKAKMEAVMDRTAEDNLDKEEEISSLRNSQGEPVLQPLSGGTSGDEMETMLLHQAEAGRLKRSLTYIPIYTTFNKIQAIE
jgi:hypothetical protein